MTRLICNEDTYTQVIQDLPERTSKFLWIGTADIKDLHVRRGKRFIPFLAVLADLVKRGVEIRLLHAKEPGPRFRRDFDKYPALIRSDRFERILCPRVHFKCIISDGTLAYFGSANLTGAGMGAKGANKRNFEMGVLTEDRQMIRGVMNEFDATFMGDHCGKCKLRSVCPDPVL